VPPCTRYRNTYTSRPSMQVEGVVDAIESARDTSTAPARSRRPRIRGPKQHPSCHRTSGGSGGRSRLEMAAFTACSSVRSRRPGRGRSGSVPRADSRVARLHGRIGKSAGHRGRRCELPAPAAGRRGPRRRPQGRRILTRTRTTRRRSELTGRRGGQGWSCKWVSTYRISGPGTGPAVLREWARIVERLGYDLLMVSDHVAITPDVAQRYPEPFWWPA
jgi:hypothetical protein